MKVIIRPSSVLPTDWFISALNSIPLPTYEEVKPYFDRMCVDGKWGKEGPACWIVVRGFRKQFIFEDLQWLRRFTPNFGFNVTACNRLLTIRSEWSKK